MSGQDLFEKFGGATGVLAIIGSGLMWAWYDALFMSSFFPDASERMAEIAAMLVFLLQIPVLVYVLFRGAGFNEVLTRRRVVIAVGIVGTVGSFIFIAAGYIGSWPLLVVGAICAGVFMATFTLCWGGLYCKEGATSAVLYLAGGFAVAIIIDVPLLFMVSYGRAISFALLPFVDALLLSFLDAQSRCYKPDQETQSAKSSSERPRWPLRSYLGISAAILCALCLIMLGFGYLQHLVSFSPANGSSGIGIQVIRGIVAVVAFLLLLMFPKRSSVLYRTGLLVIIAGFMVMSFLFGRDAFWISGAIVIAGYTIFDILKWVSFSQIAYAQSKSPIKTIAIMRLFDAVFLALGLACGLLLNITPTGHAFSSEETTVVGYLMVVAVVLLLSSEDIWGLFRPAPENEGAFALTNESLSVWKSHWGLTEREGEVLELLVLGRTQPWIAENLGISESTVGTHVRHIYQKAQVHGRQELLDCLMGGVSPESPEGTLKLD